ncbi:MAG: MATE family efflux transporter [Lachnospiraceae bacterium]|nr:MATE family efflux transporter [Lachnospiraceae bacterium]
MENELFEHAPVPKAYFTMALPVVMGMVVNLVYNIVDTFFIARTQNAQLVAGVSLCAPIFTLMIALGDIFGLGGSSLISRLFGEKKDEEGKRASGFCFYAAILCGVLVTILLLLLKTPVLHLLGATDETIGYAGQYYQYLALGAPFIIVALTPGNLIRTEGLALQSMAATILGAVVNIILDPVFIFGLNMGAGGAAIATVIGNAASVVLLVYFVRTKSRKLTVSPKNIKISGAAVASILAIGIPASVTNIMQSFGIALTNRFLAGYGTEKVAAMGIAMKVNMIVVLVMVGFAFGAQPLLGYNYGAGNKKRLKEFIRFDLMVEIGFAIVCALVLAMLAPQFVRLFMKDESIVQSGSLMLRCLLISSPMIAVVLVFTTLFQAEGKALSALILSISRQGVIFACCIVVLKMLLGYMGVICAQAVSDVITGVIALALYWKSMRKS